MQRFLFLLFILLVTASTGLAGETLQSVKARGVVRCGVGDIIPGMAEKDSTGLWRGMDVDFCRALAAAVLQKAEKVSFLPLPSRARFSALLSKEIDILSRNTSLTLGREAQIGVSFVGPLLLTGQSFLVAASDAPKGLACLDKASICLVRGSTHVQNLEDLAAAKGFSYQPQMHDSIELATEAFLKGACTAFTGDALVLAAAQKHTPGGAERFALLPNIYSKEPISPVVRQDDNQWLLVLKCVLSALLTAEECGLTQEAMRSGQGAAGNAAAQSFLQRTDSLSKSLGLEPGWAGRVVAATGNYGEMFERNLGANSAYKLDRGYNKLVRNGGLMFALPF